jgi:acetylornithine/succinyldiaminopimelate/putrescine aminotransferase
VVLVNYGTQLAQAQMEKLPPNARLHSALPAGGALAAKANAAGQASLYLGPQSVRVLLVNSGAQAVNKAAKKTKKAPAKKGAKAAPKKKAAGKAAPKKAAPQKAAPKKAPAKKPA